jgi:hypothetical protein
LGGLPHVLELIADFFPAPEPDPVPFRKRKKWRSPEISEEALDYLLSLPEPSPEDIQTIVLQAGPDRAIIDPDAPPQALRDDPRARINPLPDQMTAVEFLTAASFLGGLTGEAPQPVRRPRPRPTVNPLPEAMTADEFLTAAAFLGGLAPENRGATRRW